MGEKLHTANDFSEEKPENSDTNQEFSDKSSVLSNMPSFKEHIKELDTEQKAEKKATAIERKHYKGRLGDLEEVERLQLEVVYNFTNPEFDDDALLDEFDYLNGEYKRLRKQRDKADDYILMLDKKALSEKDPVRLRNLSILKSLANAFPYDFQDSLKDTNSPEFKRRFVILSRMENMKKEGFVNEYFNKIPGLKEEIFSPPKERIEANVVDFLTGKVNFQLVKDIGKIFEKGDIESGAKELVSYLSEVLQLKIPPEIEIIPRETESHDRGEYVSLYNHINVNYSPKDSVIETMATIAHEMWHAHQYDVIVWGDEGIKEQKINKQLYSLNNYSYQDAYNDYDSYRSQLIEQEAYLFGALIGTIPLQ